MKNLFDNFDVNGPSGSDSLDDLMNNFHDIIQQSDNHADSSLSSDDTSNSGWNDSHSGIHDNLHDSGMPDMSHSEWNDSHSGIHDNLHDSGISDMSHSEWNDSHSGIHDNLHDSGIPDMSHSDWNDSHSGFNDNLHDSGMSDMSHSGWNDSHSGIHDNLNDSGISDISHSDWNDSNTLHNFDHSGTELQHDSAPDDPHHTDSLPDLSSLIHHQPDYSDNFTDHHSFHNSIHSANSMPMHSVHFRSSTESNHPYITMSDLGYVYLKGDKEIGRVEGHTVYNNSHYNCGYWTTEGKVYDYHDNLVGWVHPDGHVYAKGKDGDLEVYETDKGVAGGAAYLLLVWCGGQTH